MAMIRLAPIALQTAIVLDHQPMPKVERHGSWRGTYRSPTGPAPNTATLSIALTSATLQTALTATDRGSIFTASDRILDPEGEEHIPEHLRRGRESLCSQLHGIQDVMKVVMMMEGLTSGSL